MTELAIASTTGVAIPKVPDYLLDRHHLLWPSPDYQAKNASKFRGLSCFISQVDAYVHKALHFCYEPPERPSQDVMSQARERHRARLCSCKPNEHRGEFVDLLALKPGVGLELPCLRVELDPWTIDVIVRLSKDPRPLPQEWAEYLVQRHDRRLCACSRRLELVR